MPKFSLNDLLNSTSKAEPTPADNFKIELISVHKLIPSADNFYSLEDVADLKDSIEMLGIQQNLTVKPITGSDTYKVIAGHRRRLASLKLVEEGKSQFEHIPCRVETNIDDIKERILLIYTNSTTRQLSDWEKVTQLDQLKELLKEYKKTHELPGRVRELLAETLNVSVSQVARIESINDNLTEEFKEELKHDNINFSTAAELSRLSVVDQKAVYEQHKETGQTNLKTVRQKKAETVHREEQPAPAPEPTPEPPKIRLTELQELLNSLVRIRAQYNCLMDIPAGERALKALETLNALIYDDIESIKASVLGEPLFAENGGGV
ncbi:ParB/RepB/Spo0J family partition protein [Sporomusa sp. KB1]|jgi:ParB family chromosome partitioning protein|uniref:ParB/RepB/Spo0J family partition protein n=1 Tax=Sporomusa sp. KB1 TaxID=943346 RepID=UPI0011A75C38|nr:ParB/RepB/Spo0J family partition protein [Sporomusa sp. KB1]TWH49612.1 ParB family chromosome partitioning protein [Sporomusa sp. KB1]